MSTTVSEFCGRNLPGRLQISAHSGNKAETSQMGAALASHVSDTDVTTGLKVMDRSRATQYTCNSHLQIAHAEFQPYC